MQLNYTIAQWLSQQINLYLCGFYRILQIRLRRVLLYLASPPAKRLCAMAGALRREEG